MYLPENKDQLLLLIRPLYPNGIFPLGNGSVIVLCLLLLCIVLYFASKQTVKAKRKRQALVILKQITDDFLKNGDVSCFCAQVSIILRRSALAKFESKQVASLTGQDWVHFLNNTGANLAEEDKILLTDQAYAPFQQDESDKPLLFGLKATRWVEQNL